MRAFFSKKNLFLRVAAGFALGVVLGFFMIRMIKSRKR